MKEFVVSAQTHVLILNFRNQRKYLANRSHLCYATKFFIKLCISYQSWKHGEKQNMPQDGALELQSFEAVSEFVNSSSRIKVGAVGHDWL
jgi:hypothetical protein